VLPSRPILKRQPAMTASNTIIAANRILSTALLFFIRSPPVPYIWNIFPRKKRNIRMKTLKKRRSERNGAGRKGST
jgi:hypothetical protein